VQPVNGQRQGIPHPVQEEAEEEELEEDMEEEPDAGAGDDEERDDTNGPATSLSHTRTKRSA